MKFLLICQTFNRNKRNETNDPGVITDIYTSTIHKTKNITWKATRRRGTKNFVVLLYNVFTWRWWIRTRKIKKKTGLSELNNNNNKRSWREKVQQPFLLFLIVSFFCFLYFFCKLLLFLHTYKVNTVFCVKEIVIGIKWT